ncbi:MAG: peptidoglycan editing factor PgeF [Candidatus Omnitrophota bacterium]
MKCTGLIKKGHLYFLKKFLEAGAIAVFSDRYKDLGFSAGEDLRPNRREALKNSGIDFRRLVCAGQIHGKRILCVDRNYAGKGALSLKGRLEGVDGFITRQEELPLAVFTADCLSIFILDPKTRAVGLIHAGWRGTRAGIATKAVEMMRKRFCSRAEDLFIGFGPAIRKCCYEVGREFGKLFSYGLIKRNEEYLLDLIACNRLQLRKTGVKEKNIFDSRLCTGCEKKRFFSFRREKEKAGRMISAIMLKA